MRTTIVFLALVAAAAGQFAHMCSQTAACGSAGCTEGGPCAKVSFTAAEVGVCSGTTCVVTPCTASPCVWLDATSYVFGDDGDCNTATGVCNKPAVVTECTLGDACTFSGLAGTCTANPITPGGANVCTPDATTGCTVGDACETADGSAGTCKTITGTTTACVPDAASCTAGEACTTADGSAGTCQSAAGVTACVKDTVVPGCTAGEACTTADGSAGTCTAAGSETVCVKDTVVPGCTVGDACTAADGKAGTCTAITGTTTACVPNGLTGCTVGDACTAAGGAAGTCQAFGTETACVPSTSSGGTTGSTSGSGGATCVGKANGVVCDIAAGTTGGGLCFSNGCYPGCPTSIAGSYGEYSASCSSAFKSATCEVSCDSGATKDTFVCTDGTWAAPATISAACQAAYDTAVAATKGRTTTSGASPVAAASVVLSAAALAVLA